MYPAIFLVIGIIMILSASWTTVTISKTKNQILVQKNELFWPKQQIFNIKDVLRIELRKGFATQKVYYLGPNPRAVPFMAIIESIRQQFRKPQQVPVSRVAILFKDGMELPLVSSKTFPDGQVFGNRNTDAIAKQVALFLEVALEEIESSP